ncbi:Uu.00g118340.m01.CDS01 [Anthostomella pinea]|uniref:Uu.00g118340.m01.CDS01 n=1 Tax=Anthostomella pinea TaxID=933095 RepID=A0AAI8YGX6_9PEZI|nr:Uu.00g118340.m01.CDS01 [Anthostomella pinea]
MGEDTLNSRGSQNRPIHSDDGTPQSGEPFSEHKDITSCHSAGRVPELALVLENLTASVQSALSYMEGPLKDTIECSLHHDERLPETRCSVVATKAIDTLHRAQQLLEPRSVILADHFLGYVSSKCLSAAVEQGIPDLLAKGPMGLSQLAEESKSRFDRLGQVMRVLYNNSIFSYDDVTGLYRNNATSRLLLSSHWTQWCNWVELYGTQFYDAARAIPAATKSEVTKSAAQISFNTDLNMFSYFQEQGWVEILHRTLSGGAQAQAPGILEDYPWADLADGENMVLMDIGGGGGGLLAALLRRFENLRGGLFDLPHVIEHTRALFHAKDGVYADVGNRVSPAHLVGGDFFQEVPRCEIYTMKWCLHDWKDDDAVRILTTIRRAILVRPKSRLIVMESILADGQSQRLTRYADIHMMMVTNGQERTESQWNQLAMRSGWDVNHIYNLRDAWVKAIEMKPVSIETES